MEISTIISLSVKGVLFCLCLQYLCFSDEITSKNLELTVERTNLLNADDDRLLNSTGHLIESGYHTRPVKKIDIRKLAPVTAGFAPLTFLRYKNFEYHAISSGDHLLFFGLANAGYAGSAFLGLYNFKTNELIEDKMLLLPWELPIIRTESMNLNGSWNFKKGGLKLSYKDRVPPRKGEIMQFGNFSREYKIKSEKLNLSAVFKFEIQSDPKKIGRYNSNEGHLQVEAIDDLHWYWHMGYKQYGLKVSGEISHNNEKIALNEKNNSVMMFDYGFGVFQYKTHWVWISSNFVLPDGRRMAFNLGGGIAKTKTSMANEDYFILEGKTVLLEPVEIKYNINDLGQPWQMHTHNMGNFKTRKLKLDFRPSKTFYDYKNYVVIKSNLAQNFGYFDGWIVDDKGEMIEINGIKGICEYHYVQW